MKAFKLVLIILAFLMIGWFGSTFGPPENTAEAMIFEKLYSFTKAMPGYMFAEKGAAKPSKVMFNGFTTYLTAEKYEEDVDKILDFYVRQYKPLPIQGISQDLMDKITDKELLAEAKKHNKLMKAMARFEELYFKHKTFGFWGTFEFHDKDLKVGSKEHIKQLGEALKTGRLGAIGTARIVMAMKEKETSKDTRVINIWSDRDFNINSFKPDALGDMPGKDIEGAPRYPGSKRLISVEQENSATLDSMVMYRGGGTVRSHMAFYRSRMPAADWAADPAFERGIEEKKIENSLFYTKRGRECTIIFTEDENTGDIISIFMLRKGKGYL